MDIMNLNPEIPTYHSILYHFDSYHHYESDTEAHLHRAIIYRLHFKIITMKNFSEWGNIFEKLNDEYMKMKEELKEFLITPKYFQQAETYKQYSEQNANNTTGSSTNQDSTPVTEQETTNTATSEPDILDIHNDIIERQLILKDMQRLFMNGINNEYFQTEKRRNILQNVLCLWSYKYKDTVWGDYKQGMHEIAGMVLFIVEKEHDTFLLCESTKPTSPNKDNDSVETDGAVESAWFCSSDQCIEMHTFHLFDCIMKDLSIMYSTNATKDALSEEKTMSTFLVYIQDVVIRALHPRLWEHLKLCAIDPQLYGTSWTRLLFGRILNSNNTEQLALWDYLFSPPVKDYPKIPFTKQFISVGPLGKKSPLSPDSDEKFNQFGLTDTSQNIATTYGHDYDDLAIRKASSSSSDDDGGGVSSSWTLRKQWLPGFPKAKIKASDHSLSHQDIEISAVGQGSSSSSASYETGGDNESAPGTQSESAPSAPVITSNVGGELRSHDNTEDVHRSMWRDTGPLTEEDIVARVLRNSKDKEVKFDKTDFDIDDEEDDDDDEEEENNNSSRDNSDGNVNDNDVQEKAKEEFFEAGPYISSEEDVEEDEDDDESVEEWPFATDDLLLKIGSAIVAILFKMRETLLVSSELDTITTLLRPFEQLRATSSSGSLDEFVYELIRLSQQFESAVSSRCSLQPIPLHAISDIMDFHNIRSATYSLDVIGAPTWREASMCIKSTPSSSLASATTPGISTASNTEHNSAAASEHKGWYWGKYIGRMVGIRNKSPSPPSHDTSTSIDTKMKRKRQLLRDYYAAHLSSDGFSSEFSVMSDLPMQMGWLRKRRPKGPMMNYNKWKRRFIVLSRDSLSYYSSETFEEKRGQFFLSPTTCAMVEDGTSEKHRLKFVIEDPSSNQKTRFFLVESDEVRQLWVNRINRAVTLLKIASADQCLPAMSSLSIGSDNRGSDHTKGSDNMGSSDGDEEEENEFPVASTFCQKLIVGSDMDAYQYASGWLKKKNLIGGGWRRLYFELVKDEILYYSETINVAANMPLGRIHLTPNTVVLNRSQGKTKHKFAIASTSGAQTPTSKRISFQGLFGGGNGGDDATSRGSTISGSGGGIIGKKVIYIAASNASEKEQWMTVIRESVERLRDR